MHNLHHIIITLAMALLPLCSSGQINIWSGTAVRHDVEMTPYLAPGPHAPAVIVCPGGSYFWHDMDGEGRQVGEWLSRNGISAFVLRYRTAYVPAFVTHYRLLPRQPLSRLSQRPEAGSAHCAPRGRQIWYQPQSHRGYGILGRGPSRHELRRTSAARRVAGVRRAGLSCGHNDGTMCS